MGGSSSSRSVWGNNLHGHEEHPINYEQGGSQPAAVAKHEGKLERLRSKINPTRIGKHTKYKPMTSSAAAGELGRLVDIGTPNPNNKILSSKMYGGKQKYKRSKKKRTKRKRTKKRKRKRTKKYSQKED